MKIELYGCEGEVIPIDEFVDNHIDDTNFNDQEKKILRDALLPSYNDIPEFLRVPRTRAEWLKKKSCKAIIVEKHGNRSAYWPDKKIKFKGCNPSKNNKTFPGESVFFGKENINTDTIPFGVLTEAQVIREILGYAFFIKHNLKTNIKPICVYSIGDWYSLVEETISETRIESCFDFKDLDIGNLMMQDAARKRKGLCYHLESEVNLKAVNVSWYTYKKALLLLAMHFNGGFRDLLNSNIGNDVLTFKDCKANELYLCDFDTFRVIAMPEKPTINFLRRFYLQCFIEVVKGSLPIIEYVHYGRDIIGPYLQHSSLYRAYKREFYSQAALLGWDLSMLKEIEKWVLAAPIFKQIVGEIVPSYERLKELPDREPTYKLH